MFLVFLTSLHKKQACQTRQTDKVAYGTLQLNSLNRQHTICGGFLLQKYNEKTNETILSS